MVLPLLPIVKQERGLVCQIGFGLETVSLLRSAWSLLWTLPLYWQVTDCVTFGMSRGGHWQASWMLVYVKTREALGMTVFYTTVTPLFSKRKGCYCPRDLWSFEVQRLQIPICQCICCGIVFCHSTVECTTAHQGPAFPVRATKCPRKTLDLRICSIPVMHCA